MAMARRVSLFEREVAVKLAPLAIDILHQHARMISEGEVAGDVYAGSTMMTVDLAAATAMISDPPDASTAQKVAFLYAADEHARDRARRMAIVEARKLSGCDLVSPHVDLESRARGPHVHLSLNVEARRPT